MWTYGPPRGLDCDGEVDEADAAGASTFYADGDGDGFGDAASSTTACDMPAGYVANDGDCDDTDGTINPGEDEFCDSLDNNCDGVIDEDEAVDATTWYADTDLDGYGDPNASTQSCDAPEGTVGDAGDCDDAAGHPPGRERGVRRRHRPGLQRLRRPLHPHVLPRRGSLLLR